MACFSDTFVVYADDDSAATFAAIEQVARWIVNEHIQQHMPLRAAISCEELYADKDGSIFIGRALLEAYKNEEDQAWIGFLLCRSATRRLKELGLLPSERLNYRRYKIPWKTPTRSEHKALYAYLIGTSCPSNGKNLYLEKLREMMAAAKTRKVKSMYRKTIQFLEYYGVLRPVGAAVAHLDDRAN